jgi:hypothetical protein
MPVSSTAMSNGRLLAIVGGSGSLYVSAMASPSAARVPEVPSA